MKFGQAIEHNKRIFKKKKNPENEAGKLVPDLFLLFKKALYEINASDPRLVSIFCDSPQLDTQ